MFYISTLELSLTCALILLIFIVPYLIKRSYAEIDHRLKKLEKKSENSKSQVK